MTTINPSWYASRGTAVPARSALAGEQTVDVAVLGGGLTGLSCALELAERGRSAVLLEAGRIGSQASGRNGGQALQGLAASMAVVERLVGFEAAQAIWTMSREALALLKQRIQQHGIACDLVERGYVYAATHAGQLQGLASWRDEAAARYGYPDLVLLERDAMADYVRSPAYVGGLLDPAEVHLDPLAYTLGIAAAAEAAGAVLHEQSRAIELKAIDGGWLVRTEAGSVRCRQVVLGLNAGVGTLVPALARHFLPVESFIVTTAPLGAELARSLIPGDVAVADCKHVLNYFRLSRDHRLLFGGRASGMAASRREDTQARMLAVFPQLGEVEIEHAWGGLVDVTPHKLPHFGELAPGCYFAQGYSGHGLALTGMAGRLMAEAITGQTARWANFANLPQYTLPTALPGFARALVALGMSWYQLRDWAEACWYRD
ncbi:FAD-binding oxidoreductase [Chitinimonas sp.]|uniref:NAD(P)/FAD-dependent oxidoreductase n=1 Tax=Chitinimonas sp. TaxID=1934313 RepID=UPI002F934A49